jgi:hypothetical protein
MLSFLSIMSDIVNLILFAFTPQHGVKASDQQNSTQDAVGKRKFISARI